MEHDILKESFASLTYPFGPCSGRDDPPRVHLFDGPGVISGELHDSVESRFPAMYADIPAQPVEEVTEEEVGVPENHPLKTLLQKKTHGVSTTATPRKNFDPTVYLNARWSSGKTPTADDPTSLDDVVAPEEEPTPFEEHSTSSSAPEPSRDDDDGRDLLNEFFSPKL